MRLRAIKPRQLIRAAELAAKPLPATLSCPYIQCINAQMPRPLRAHLALQTMIGGENENNFGKRGVAADVGGEIKKVDGTRQFTS